MAALVASTLTLTTAGGSTAGERTSRVLRDGTPQQAGLVTAPIEAMETDLRSYLNPSPTRPLYAGGVVLAGHDGYVVQRAAAGYALRYADGDGTELPRDQWVPARTDTIFDLASVSKLFTAIALVQQVEAGTIDLDRTVASYIPAFAANGKQAVTVRQLLTHTSGFPAWLPLWSKYTDAGGAHPGGVRGEAGEPAGQHVPLLRPEHDHGRQAGRARHRPTAGPAWSTTGSPGRSGCATPATTRRRPSSTGSPRRSTRPRRHAAWSAAACTTRTPGR